MATEVPSGKSPFVGRKDERARIRQMVETPDEPWLLWIEAGAGAGKSRLLEMALDMYSPPDYLSSDLFDFFTAGLRARDSILVALAERFGVNDGRFAEAHAAYQRGMHQQDVAARSHGLRQMQAELVAALSERFAAARRGLIVADTVELVADTSVGRWFFNELLPELAPQVAVIAAGRPPRAGASRDVRNLGIGETLELGGFTAEEVGELLEARLPGFRAADSRVFVDHVHSLTADKTEGQALLVDLVAYRLNPHSVPQLGETLSRNDVMGFDAATLKEKLVDEVMTGTPQGDVIFWMTHADHGFDEAMLRALISPDDLETDDYAGFLDDLRPLPFIKYHEDAHVVRVHDYFRDRARDEIWPAQDPDFFTRARKISEKLTAYFEERLDELSPHADPSERDRLMQQWLFHLLFADRRRAYAELWQALDDAWHNGRIDFMNDLLEMMGKVDEMMPTPAGQPQVLRRMIQTVGVWAQQEDWSIARETLAARADEVIADKSIPARLRYSAMVAKGMALGDTSRTEEANDALRTALEGYDELLESKRAADSGDAEARRRWEAEMGIATVEGIRRERYLILSSLGYNERARGNFDAALRYFQDSYAMSKEGGDLSWQATAAYQVGTVLRYQGGIPEANAWIQKGLAMSRELGAFSLIGYSLLALGRLQRDTHDIVAARHSFEEAKGLFEEIDSAFDLATAWTELGWIETLERHFELAESNFQNALRIVPGSPGPSLMEKYGKMYLRRAAEAEDSAAQQAFLAQAEKTLREGVKISGELDRQLYAALCLAALVRLADMRGDETALYQWVKQLSRLRDTNNPFDWAYAEMEEILFERAMRRAVEADGSYSREAVFEAADHYLRMFAHLARHSPIHYREKRAGLSRWLYALPESLRLDVGRRLIADWRALPDELPQRHPGFITTVKIACDFE